jgi:hypothetical protein
MTIIDATAPDFNFILEAVRFLYDTDPHAAQLLALDHAEEMAATPEGAEYLSIISRFSYAKATPHTSYRGAAKNDGADAPLSYTDLDDNL